MRTHSADLQQRLLILRPQALSIPGLTAILESLTEFAIISEVAGLDEALRECAAARPDLALLITDWSKVETLTMIQTLRQQHPGIGISVIGAQAAPLRVAAAFTAGARGYMTYEAISDVPAVLRLVARGGFGCCSVSARQLMDRITARQPLSPREQLIAAQIAAGQTNRDIAQVCGVKPSTVETHIERILQKIGGQSRVDIATWWVAQAGVARDT